MRSRPRPSTVGTAIAFEITCILGIRNISNFVAAFPTAHALARLRFNASVTAAAARHIATGSGGLTPDRAGITPAGRQMKFHEVIAFFTPFQTA